MLLPSNGLLCTEHHSGAGEDADAGPADPGVTDAGVTDPGAAAHGPHGLAAAHALFGGTRFISGAQWSCLCTALNAGFLCA